jgi:hypothetical protein
MPGIIFPAGRTVRPVGLLDLLRLLGERGRRRAVQPVGLLDLLRLLAERGRTSVWLLKNLEVAPSPSAVGCATPRIEDCGSRGAELLDLAAGYTQIIDGELIAHDSPGRPSGRAARRRRHRVDVYAEDKSLLSQIAAGVPDARSLPE